MKRISQAGSFFKIEGNLYNCMFSMIVAYLLAQ